ncbi:hypothetical protein J1614_000716 [Plenodomus biglobosus]|nr:hypothetical protein J1614_000716 [Plenodomus biglobosus]
MAAEQWSRRHGLFWALQTRDFEVETKPEAQSNRRRANKYPDWHPRRSWTRLRFSFPQAEC